MSTSVLFSQRGIIRHRRETFGSSVLGANLDVFLPQEDIPHFLLIAGQHGDEPETTTVLSHVLRTIPEAALRCAVVLGANPDGLARGTRCNAQGVDLNRNFPTRDWRMGPILHSWVDGEAKNVELSTGKSPASEPETTALLKLVKRLAPRGIISLHGRLACIDDAHTSAMGAWLAEQTKLPLVPNVGYATPGSFGTWASEYGIPLVTVEFPDEGMLALRRRFEHALIAILTGSGSPWEAENN